MMSRPNRHNRLFLLVSVLTVGVVLMTSGCLWGVVTDSTTGAPIAGASVSYKDANGHIGWTTTNSKGWYAFDLASGPIPAAGPITVDVSASGYDPISVPRLADYKDNPKASGANLSSFWEVQSFALTPSLAPAVTADMAVTDLYPDNQPFGTLFARVTNNGPDSLVNSSIQLWCEAARTNSSNCDQQTLGPINVSSILSLDPGQTGIVGTAMGLDTSKYWYEASCTVLPLQGAYGDPSPANDSYTEIIPPPVGDLELTAFTMDPNTHEIGLLVKNVGSAGYFCWTVNIGSYGHRSCGLVVPVVADLFLTGDHVSGTQSVTVSIMGCSPETNNSNNQLAATCDSVANICQ